LRATQASTYPSKEAQVGDLKMLSKVKIYVAAVVAASLFSGVSYGLETGNVTFNPVNGTCQPNPLTGYPWTTEENYNVAILLGNATISGDNEYFMTLFSAFGASGGDVFDTISWLYTFNATAGTYSLISNGISGAAQVTGTYTGSISSNGFGGYTINLKLNCGATIVGGTVFVGS
jgi:hypothetical protein